MSRRPSRTRMPINADVMLLAIEKLGMTSLGPSSRCGL